MPLSPRVTIPVVSAVLCVVVIGGYFFWQLENTQADLTAMQTPVSSSGTSIVAADTTATAAPINDSGDVSLLHLRQGDVFALEGQWKDAEDEYQKAVSAGGGLTALRKLAQAQLERRDFRGASDTLDQLKRAGESPEDQLLLQSLIDLHSGQLDQARTLLTAADDSPQKQYGLALLAIITNDNDTAKKELQLVENGWEPVLRSYAQTLMGAYSEYALFPDSPAIHLQTLVAHALAQAQECELALPIVSQVTRSQDDYRDAWIVQGFCELTTERYQDALASLERAYQLDPEKPETQYFLGRTYSALGDHGNALTFLQYALQNGFTPESEVRQWIATEAVADGKIDVALDQQDALTNAQDATIDSFNEYVTTALAAGEKQQALVKAQQAAKRFPDEARAWDLLGWAQDQNGDKTDAKQNLTKALQMDPALQSAQEHLKQM